MRLTYPATLRDGQLEWGTEGAPQIPADASVAVHVTLLARVDSPVKSGAAMAQALEAIAAAGGPSGFADPVVWQEQTRTDRSLPGRAE